MGLDDADVLDELALYPDRRERGMSRAELLDALGLDVSSADSLGHRLGALARRGLVSRRGLTNRARWRVTTAGMGFQPDEDWSGERFGAFTGSERSWDIAA